MSALIVFVETGSGGGAPAVDAVAAFLVECGCELDLTQGELRYLSKKVHLPVSEVAIAVNQMLRSGQAFCEVAHDAGPVLYLRHTEGEL